jgi:hypothetical protein
MALLTADIPFLMASATSANFGSLQPGLPGSPCSSGLGGRQAAKRDNPSASLYRIFRCQSLLVLPQSVCTGSPAGFTRTNVLVALFVNKSNCRARALSSLLHRASRLVSPYRLPVPTSPPGHRACGRHPQESVLWRACIS